jgi:hypothetical protein
MFSVIKEIYHKTAVTDYFETHIFTRRLNIAITCLIITFLPLPFPINKKYEFCEELVYAENYYLITVNNIFSG